MKTREEPLIDIQSELKKHEESIEILNRMGFYISMVGDLTHEFYFTVSGQVLGKEYYKSKIDACSRLISYLENKYKKINTDKNKQKPYWLSGYTPKCRHIDEKDS